MKCPCCDREMQSGYLQSGRPFIWGPKKKRVAFRATREDEFEVSEGFWNGCFAKADYCSECKKILVSVE